MESPTKEQIFEAAKTSKQARDALMKLYPSVFETDKYLDLTKLLVNTDFEPTSGAMLKRQPFTIESVLQASSKTTNVLLAVRGVGKYLGKGFYLSDSFNWEIVVDDAGGESVLVPTKKIK